MLLSASTTIAGSIFTGTLLSGKLSGQFVLVNRNLFRHSMCCSDNIQLSNVISSTVLYKHETITPHENVNLMVYSFIHLSFVSVHTYAIKTFYVARLFLLQYVLVAK